MGSLFSPVIADFFMEDFEVTTLARATHKLLCWFHYVAWTSRQIGCGRTYEVWQKSNMTGNAMHEPTMLLPPPSHGS